MEDLARGLPIILLFVALFAPVVLGVFGIVRLFRMGEKGLGWIAVVLLFVFAPVSWILGITAFFREPEPGSAVYRKLGGKLDAQGIVAAQSVSVGSVQESVRRPRRIAILILVAAASAFLVAVVLLVVVKGTGADPQSDASESSEVIAVTSEPSSTTMSRVAADEIPASEWATVNALFYRGIEAQMSMANSTPDDVGALADEAKAIAEAWLALAKTGSEIGRDAYLCKAAGFEQWTVFFLAIGLGDADTAEAAVALAEEYDIRGSDLLDELDDGMTLLPAGSPRSCP